MPLPAPFPASPPNAAGRGRRRAGLLLLSGAIGTLPGVTVADPADAASPSPAEAVALRYKTYRNWDIVLPEETFHRVSGPFSVAALGPGTFAVEADGTALRIDRDGDGKIDAKVEGETGLVTLRGRTAEGEKTAYSLRLRRSAAGWFYASSGAALGTIDGQKVRLIDQNANGRYDDWGEDAIVIGAGRHATHLSPIVSIRGRLYDIDPSADGRRLAVAPHEGPSGLVDLSSEFDTEGKLLVALLRSEDGSLCFDVSGPGAVRVPAGTYVLEEGRIGLGRNEVRFARGDSDPLTIRPDATATLAMGQPITIDFQFVRQPSRIVLSPDMVRYVGRAGEVYAAWNPFGGSPEFDVRDEATGAALGAAVFGGT